MAKNKKAVPVATPVATGQASQVSQDQMSPEQISQGLGTVTQPVLSTPKAKVVYSPTNIQQIDIPSTKRASEMTLEDLEKKLAKANSLADLNQIQIMNQPKAMGVLTGEAAYRSKLDTARVNAFNSLYNNRLLEEQRKEEERQQFIATYGADPNSRPEGMSKREFIIELAAGRQNDKLTQEFKEKQLDYALKQKQLSGAGETAPGASPELAALAQAYTQFNGDWGQTANFLASQGYDVSSGSVIDNELRRRNGLDPIIQMSASEKIAQEKLQQTEQESIEAAKASIPDLENKISLLESAGTRGVGAGVTGAVERNWPDLFGAKADNLGIIKAIIGQETLQTLLNLKAKGGTLGAISEKELSILQSSASRVGAAEITDKNGNVTGYRMTESEFKKEIQRMKDATQRVLDEARKKAGITGFQGTKVIAPDGQEIIITD